MMHFYQPLFSEGVHILDNEEFQHCVKVLRKREGDVVGILDGKGNTWKTEIKSISKREVEVNILEASQIPAKGFYTHIVIAPTKSLDRIEWFVEKACEMGVDEITFIKTDNSERPRIKLERLEKKTVSALKQSKSGFLTILNPLTSFSSFLNSQPQADHKYLAVVNPENPYLATLTKPATKNIMLIGPEGDFSSKEVDMAMGAGYKPVSIGRNVLRTETAGIVCCQFFNMVNDY